MNFEGLDTPHRDSLLILLLKYYVQRYPRGRVLILCRRRVVNHVVRK
jgi:hypothetical protein